MFVVCIHGRAIPGDPKLEREECLDCEEHGALLWLESITRRPSPVTATRGVSVLADAFAEDICDAHARIDSIRARRVVLSAITPENVKRPGTRGE